LHDTGAVFIKRHTVRKDGKVHAYYSLCESVRVARTRTVQRRLLNLGELNSTQLERWQRSVDVVEENGQSRQMRLFTDRDGGAPNSASRVPADEFGEVVLSTLEVRRPRVFGDCWLGCRLWEELELDKFWENALEDHRGPCSWAKVLELLAVNRICDPGSELFVHERWFGGTAMDFLLDADAAIAAKDRLYRALDKALPHKEALMKHLQNRWTTLFHADCQVLLYDLTSTYFEGEAASVSKARRGYSRDHRPDCLQVVVALVVSAEGFPLCYEVFDGNTRDESTLDEILHKVEDKYGYKGRLWVFDRGIVSEENLETLRQRGASYLVGTPRRLLRDFEKELLHGEWQEIEGRPGIQAQTIQRGGEVFLLARSADRARKESAIRKRPLLGLHRSLRRLELLLNKGRLKNARKADRRLGRLEERYASAWPYLQSAEITEENGHPRLVWKWSKERLRHLRLRDGAYLLRSNLEPLEPDLLWRQYIQLTDVEEAFRCLKSELSIRPIWHRTEARVQAHIMVAFLAYCLWVLLKQKLKTVAGSLTPARALESLHGILMVEVWFDLRDGRKLCLPRITQPEKEQALLLHHLRWPLPDQPPPRIFNHQIASTM
jgi:transposase